MEGEKTPLISIVLCFFNEEKFLKEAIVSVLNQTCQDWELITVDDGSTDTSTAIAKQFAKQYPEKIIYHHHPGHNNEGLSASRMSGIEKSKGKYIALLDADDVWLHDKLENQLAIFKTHPEATVILSASEYWYSWEDVQRKDFTINVGCAEGIYDAPSLALLLYPLGRGAAPCPSGIMMQRSVFSRCVFEESYRGIFQMYEDQAFLCKVYLKEKVYVSHDCNNRYRQRKSSIVSSVVQSGKYDEVRRYYLNWFKQYLKSQRIKIRSVNATVDRALMPYQHPIRYQMMVTYPQKGKKFLSKIYRRLGRLSLIRS